MTGIIFVFILLAETLNSYSVVKKHYGVIMCEQLCVNSSSVVKPYGVKMCEQLCVDSDHCRSRFISHDLSCLVSKTDHGIQLQGIRLTGHHLNSTASRITTRSKSVFQNERQHTTSDDACASLDNITHWWKGLYEGNNQTIIGVSCEGSILRCGLWESGRSRCTSQTFWKMLAAKGCMKNRYTIENVPKYTKFPLLCLLPYNSFIHLHGTVGEGSNFEFILSDKYNIDVLCNKFILKTAGGKDTVYISHHVGQTSGIRKIETINSPLLDYNRNFEIKIQFLPNSYKGFVGSVNIYSFDREGNKPHSVMWKGVVIMTQITVEYP